MISVTQALGTLFDLVEPLASETVPLTQAVGRVMVQDAQATRNQPPFAASAMDGYAVAAAGGLQVGQAWDVIGEAAAGHRFDGPVAQGQAVRIFTGAPLPQGTDFVIIQENMDRRDNGTVILTSETGDNAYVRPAGADFDRDFCLNAPKRLTANDVALLAAMNVAAVKVTRKPTVAIIATGDELVSPGESPSDDQIIASNSYGLHAMLSQQGADPRLLPIARDRASSLIQAFELAQGADLIVTIGGASVGDHDLVAGVAADLGMQQSFYKVAMRPGKPLMAGRIATSAMVGLPGNPVSAMVCGEVFLRPLLDKMLGLGAQPRATLKAPLARDIGANGPREHYMRAQFENGTLTIADRQDSALLTVLARANALAVRPPHAPAQSMGEQVRYILL